LATTVDPLPRKASTARPTIPIASAAAIPIFPAVESFDQNPPSSTVNFGSPRSSEVVGLARGSGNLRSGGAGSGFLTSTGGGVAIAAAAAGFDSSIAGAGSAAAVFGFRFAILRIREARVGTALRRFPGIALFENSPFRRFTVLRPGWRERRRRAERHHRTKRQCARSWRLDFKIARDRGLKHLHRFSATRRQTVEDHRQRSRHDVGRGLRIFHLRRFDRRAGGFRDRARRYSGRHGNRGRSFSCGLCLLDWNGRIYISRRPSDWFDDFFHRRFGRHRARVFVFILDTGGAECGARQRSEFVPERERLGALQPHRRGILRRLRRN
jgi:hypothetical protein